MNVPVQLVQRLCAKLEDARSKKQATADQWMRVADMTAKVSDETLKKKVLALLADGVRGGEFSLVKLSAKTLAQLKSDVVKMGGQEFIQAQIENTLATRGPVEKLSDAAEAASASDSKSIAQVIALMQQVGDKSPEVSDGFCDGLAAGLFSDPKNVQLLEEAMAGSDGAINLTAAKVLAWHYRRQGNQPSREFISRLDKRTKDGKAAGDTLARWNLAAAYASGFTNAMFIRRTDGDEYIRRALSAAASDEVKLLCLQELASSGVACNSYKYALKIINSMAGQFKSPQKETLAALIEDLTKRQKEQEQTEFAGDKRS